MVNLEAIIFDVDGTLADTEEAHRQAFNDTFQQHGLTWHWSVEDYLVLLEVTGGKERIRHFIDTSQARIPEPVVDLNAYIAGLHRDKTDRYQAIIENGQLPLRTGVKRLLQEARQAGLQLAIATTTSRSNVRSLLEINLGADACAWFAVMGTGEDVSQKKPHPEVYDIVLQRLGLDASACIALEDSKNGLLAAQAANLSCVITTNDYTREETFLSAAIVVNHLGESDLPFSVVQGEAAGFQLVSVDMLRSLHAKSHA